MQELLATIPSAKAARWNIRLFGKLEAISDQSTLSHLSMRRNGVLLACLVVRAPDPIPREGLLDLLWPEALPETARNRLRVLLNNLRRQLEPAGVRPGSVLIAEHNTVSLRPDAFTSDYHDFLRSLEAAKASPDDEAAVTSLETAVSLYRGEFLPGCYDEWILAERRRLADLHYQALRDLVRRLLSLDRLEAALEHARQAVAVEPLDEEAHCDLMRVFGALGQPSAGLRQYEQLKRLLWEEMQAQPSESTDLLADEMRSGLGHGVAQTRRKVRPTRLRAPEYAEVQQRTANLPPRLTRFFGRKDEIRALCERLSLTETMRLVSLLGPGGTGKTRLAIEVAEQLKADYAGYVAFVPLAEVADPRDVGRAITQALRLPPANDLDPLSQAVLALKQAPSLLVLDNMEHLLPEAAPQVEYLLREAALCRILATSRQCIGVEGEQEVLLGPLGLPQDAAGIEELAQYPGIALFVDRARSVHSDFALTADNAEDVVEFCRMLEGMPLAIELAAARVRVMSPGEMRRQTGRLLHLLVDVRGGKVARHRSLRATLEWSYHLLKPDERSFFNALAVFLGGFTAQAAARAAWGDPADEMEALAMLERLTAASLLKRAPPKQGETRFSVLQPLREFGLERLVETGREIETRRRHLAYFAQVVQGRASSPFWWSAEEKARVAIDDDNLRAALEFGLRDDAEPEDGAFALHLASSLCGYWEVQGRWTEGRSYLKRALSLPASEETGEARRNVLRGAGALANHQGDCTAARSISEEGLRLAKEADDPHCVAGCLYNLGVAAFHQGDYQEAGSRINEALRLFTERQDLQGIAACLSMLGSIAFYQDDHVEAEERLMEALGVYPQVGDRLGAAGVLVKLGNVLRNQSYYDAGQARFLEALKIFEETGSRQGVAHCLHDMGLVASFQGRYRNADRYFEDALKIFQEIGHQRGIAGCLINIGSIAQDEGDYQTALSRYAEVIQLSRKIGDRRNVASCLFSLGHIALEQGDHSAARARFLETIEIYREIAVEGGVANCFAALGMLAVERGDPVEARRRMTGALEIYREMKVHGGVLYALNLAAYLLQLEGDVFRAACLAGAVATLREPWGFGRSFGEKRRLEVQLAAMRAALGDAEFSNAWREGETWSLPQAIEEALRRD